MARMLQVVGAYEQVHHKALSREVEAVPGYPAKDNCTALRDLLQNYELFGQYSTKSVEPPKYSHFSTDASGSDFP